MPTDDRLDQLSPKDLRQLIRAGRLNRRTAGLAPGYVQANLIVLPEAWASDFLLLCVRNPKPLPLIDVTDPGDPEPRRAAPGADVRTDQGMYSVYREGELVAEVEDIRNYWRDDLVAFLIGCSLTFDAPLIQARVPMRQLLGEQQIPTYVSSIPLAPGRRLSGPMAVSMRPVPAPEVARVSEITRRYPFSHGGPIHVGDPASLGIGDVLQPDGGHPPVIEPGEVPMFWACAITARNTLIAAKPELLIAPHSARCFITDIWAENATA